LSRAKPLFCGQTLAKFFRQKPAAKNDKKYLFCIH